MVQAAVKERYDEYLEILNDMLKQSPEDRNAFLFKKIKRESEKLRMDNPVFAYVLLGVVACLEKRFDDMHNHHRNAISLCNDFQTNHACAVSLLNSKRYKEAYDQTSIAYNLAAGSQAFIAEALDTLIKCCSALDYENELDRFLKQWKNLTGEDHQMSFPEDNSDNLKEMLDYFDNIIENHTDEIIEFDPELIARADRLIKKAEAHE